MEKLELTNNLIKMVQPGAEKKKKEKKSVLIHLNIQFEEEFLPSFLTEIK